MSLLERLRSVSPTSIRATLHQASGPLIVLLVAYGFTNENQAAAIIAAVIAVVDLALALLHSESTARSLIYPALATVAAVLVNYGVATEDMIFAVLGVVAAVAGGGLAARHTPESSYAGRHRLAD